MKEFDYIIFIGRFQPFHLGHEAVVKEALRISKYLIILIGSTFKPRTFRNPFIYNERKKFIRESFSKKENKRIIISSILDYTYNDEEWVKNTERVVNGIIAKYPKPIGRDIKIGLIGYYKDRTSYYLSLFNKWERINVPSFKDINATEIRENFFGKREILKKFLNPKVTILLQRYKKSSNFKKISKEYNFIKKYKKRWENTPHKPIFVTIDSLVISSGYILLIKRKNYPGKGLFALPGGFVENDEKLKDAMIRELKEESRIEVSSSILVKNIKKREIFDEPHRSERGRVITCAYLIELKLDKLPKIEGGDDAKKAFWIPLSKIKSKNMFEDHFHIIQKMLS